MANSVVPDQIPCPVVSDLGQHSLLRPVCPNTSVKHDKLAGNAVNS